MNSRNNLMLIFMGMLILCGMMVPLQSKAQDLTRDYNDSRILALGISIGHYGYGYLGTRNIGLIPLTAYYEMGVSSRITAGPVISYARWDYRLPGAIGGADYSWSFLTLGGRGSYHLTRLLNEWFDADIDEVRWDFYGTLVAGLEFRSFNDRNGNVDYTNQWNLFLGPVVGARYHLNERIGLFLELGRGTLGVVTLGASAHF